MLVNEIALPVTVVGYRESKQGSGPFSKSSKQNNAYVCAFWYKGKSANRTKKSKILALMTK